MRMCMLRVALSASECGGPTRKGGIKSVARTVFFGVLSPTIFGSATINWCATHSVVFLYLLIKIE
jgi:hypothetical protein